MTNYAMEPPVFIVGASRSGTTMLRLVLNAHPHIGVPNEFSYFTSVPQHWLKVWRHIPVAPEQYQHFIRNQLKNKECLKAVGVEVDTLLERMLEAADSRDLSIPYRLMLEAYAEAEGKSRWGEKTPTNLFYADILHEMFPEARFIHLVRDPRAVVRSANNFPRLPDDIVINATNWLHFLQTGYQRLTQSVPSSRWCTIRYEDLTTDPQPAVRAMCQFIDAPFHPRMLNFHKDATAYMPATIDQLGGDRKVTRPIYTDKQEKWRSDLSEHEIGVVEYICGDVMTAFGYEPTGARIQWSGALDATLKYTYAALKRWQHRKERFHLIRYQPLGRFGQQNS